MPVKTSACVADDVDVGAALLGTLAGISIAFISMRPTAQIWGSPVDRPTGVRDHHDRFFTGRKFPGNIPIGLAALLVGTAIGWIGGYMSAPDVVTAAKDIAIGLPTLNINLLISGLSAVALVAQPAHHVLWRARRCMGDRPRWSGVACRSVRASDWRTDGDWRHEAPGA